MQFLAHGLKKESREADHIGRMGGDEFMMVLPDTDARGAVRVCRRVARYIEKTKDQPGEGLPVPTLSFGIAVYPNCGSSADELIRMADLAMYEAKAVGRNCWRLGGGLPEDEVSEAKA